jgi:CubicO group peptidase (beta-lactamase class C family)
MSFKIDSLLGGWIRALTISVLAIISGALLFAFPAGDAPATGPGAALSNAPSVTASGWLMTREDVEAFLDGLVPLQIQRESIAGAVVSVVKDGAVLLAKGYGYADVEKKKPVTPDATLFRPGSISKLFTWTAVMQFVEQGKIDLDKDVNSYLDFKIPPFEGKPITFRNLMTHTPGFEESVKLLFLNDAKDIQPLGSYVAKYLPARIFPPGTTPAYSNFGVAIAGYIVERISGEPFNQYIDRHILKPLGMNRTTFEQPLPDALKPLMSRGYAKASEPAKDFELVQASPAGSVSTTADDMTRFMLAHLQEGRYGEAQILKPETVRLMHARTFEVTPFTNAMALGFYEESRNGHRIIGHGGDTEWFHSDLHLVPDMNLGFFVSYNSAGKGEVSPRSALWTQFLDRYYPFQPTAGEKVSKDSSDIGKIVGRYDSSRRSETKLLAFANPFSQAVVSSNSDGTISVDAFKDFAGEVKRFERIGPMLFREVGGQALLAWKTAPDGTLVMAMDRPYAVFQKVGVLRNGLLHTIALGGSLAIFLLTLLLWPIAAMARKHYGKPLEWTVGQKRRRRLVRVVCLIDLVFIGTLVVIFSGDLPTALLSSRLDVWIHALQVLGLLGAAGSLVVAYCVLRSWGNSRIWLWTKVWDGLILLGAAGYVFFVLSWHLLNFNLNY